MARERIRLEQEATAAAQARLDAERAAHEAAQTQLAAEQEARAAAEELLQAETERTEALRAAAAAARRKVAYKRGRFNAAHDRARAYAAAEGEALGDDVQQHSLYAPGCARVAVSTLANIVQTTECSDFEEAGSEDQDWETIAADEHADAEWDPEISAIEALNEHIASEIAVHSSSPVPIDASADDLDKITKDRIADLTSFASVGDSRSAASRADFPPARRSNLGALAGGVTVVAAAVVSWIFVGWTPYSGSAEARRAESVKPISVVPAKPREIALPLSTLDLPTLSLRMRLAEPAQPQNDAAARGEREQ